MRHFVGYHNTSKMGYPASKLADPRIFTSNSVADLPSNAIWLISAEGQKPKAYYLAAVFKVVRISEGTYDHAGFKNAAYGEGKIFGESICLDGSLWFRTLQKAHLNFKNGLAEMNDALALHELKRLAGAYAL